MESSELSGRETDVLLALYSGCEVLWNPECPDYNVPSIRLSALRTILNGLRLETGKSFKGYFVLNCIRKVESTYKEELKEVLDKEENSTASGEPYKSQWRWFNFLDSFLRKKALKSEERDPDPSLPAFQGSNTLREADENSESEDDYNSPVANSDGDGDGGDRVVVVRTEAEMAAAATRQGGSQQPTRVKRSSAREFRLIDANDSDYSPPADYSPPRNQRQVSTRHSTRIKKPRLCLDVESSHSDSPSRDSFQCSRSGSTPSRTVSDKRGKSTSNENKQSVEGNTARVCSRIADTLHAVQTLLARSLSDQDQPTHVFARHVASELEQILDFKRRKQCMLDIQRVLNKYQTQQENGETDLNRIKLEKGSGILVEDVDDDNTL